MFENTSAQEVALVAKSNKNDTKIDHKWDQSGPGRGGQVVPENQRKYDKKKKTRKSNKTNILDNVLFFVEIWDDVRKIRRAQRLGIYCGIINNGDKNVL